MEQWRAGLNERIKTGAIVLPEWFPQIQFGSWDCQPRQRTAPAGTPGALMDALERLVAIQEIRDQIARYAIFYDDKNWDDFAELWADDAAFVGPGMAFEGKQAVLDFLTTCLPDDYTGKHMNSPRTDRADRSRAGARAHRRRLDHDGLREPDRRALRRHASGWSTAAGCSSGAPRSSCRTGPAARRCPTRPWR